MHARTMRADAKRIRQPTSKNKRLPNPKNQISSKLAGFRHPRKLSRGEQVAAVCYRVRREIEFLLVRTRGGARWTFPKGSAEPGLTPAQAAAMEAFEEAGVHGRIEQASFARYVFRKCGKSESSFSGRELTVHAYLCQVVRLARPKEPDRDRTWFSAEEARRRLQKGREPGAAAALASVIEKAILLIEGLRIEDLQKENKSAGDQSHRHAALQSFSREPLGRDALQRVQFEARLQAHGWEERVPSLPKGIRKLEATQSFSSMPEMQPRRLLQ